MNGVELAPAMSLPAYAIAVLPSLNTTQAPDAATVVEPLQARVSLALSGS